MKKNEKKEGNDTQASVRGLQIQIGKYVLIASIVISGLSFILMDSPIPFITGLVFGTLIGILNFMELGKTLSKAVTMQPQSAQTYTTKKYFIRFVLTAVVLYVSVTADHINILGTIVGLLLIKVVILTTNLFNDKEYFKNIIRKEE